MDIKAWYVYTMEVCSITKKVDTIKFIRSVGDG